MTQVPELNAGASAEVILGQNRAILGIPLGKIKEIKTAKPDNLRGVSVPDKSGDSWKESRDNVNTKVMDAIDPSNPKREEVLVEVAKTLKSPADVKKLYEQYLINKSSPGYSPAEVAVLEATARVVATHESNAFIADARLSLEKEATEWVTERKSSLSEQRQTQEGLRDQYAKDLNALRAEVEQLEQAVKKLDGELFAQAQKDIGAMQEKLSPYSDLMEEFVRAVRNKHKDEIGAITKARQRFRKPEYSLDSDEMRYMNKQLATDKNFLAEALTDAERNTLDVNPLHRQASQESSSLAQSQEILNYVSKNLGSILSIGGDGIFPRPLASENALDVFSQDNQSHVTSLAVSVLMLHPEMPIKDEAIRPVIEAARKRVSDGLTTARADEIKRNSPKYQEINGMLETKGKERGKKEYDLEEADRMLTRNDEEAKGLEGSQKIRSHMQDGLENIAKSIGVQQAGLGESVIREAIASTASSLMMARLANDALFYDNEQLANYAQRRTARFGEIRKALYDKLLSPDQADPKTREDLQSFISAYDETVIGADEFVDRKRWEEAQTEAMKSILDGSTLTSSSIGDRSDLMGNLAKVVGDSNGVVEVRACPVQIPGKEYTDDLYKAMWIQRTGDGFVVTSRNSQYYFHFDIGNDRLGCRVATDLSDPGNPRPEGLSFTHDDLFKNVVGMNGENILLVKPKI